ncbi:MAG: hypothetical protein RBT41_12080, partial [Clostridia bacterium]|nr:hypothetical protein [Clostridia bacterium]
MSVQRENTADKWRNHILSSAEAAEIKEFLLACRIINIKVSQAQMAWEIAFQSPYPPNEETKQRIQAFWERT